jgi:hypothetical protein
MISFDEDDHFNFNPKHTPYMIQGVKRNPSFQTAVEKSQSKRASDIRSTYLNTITENPNLSSQSKKDLITTGKSKGFHRQISKQFPAEKMSFSEICGQNPFFTGFEYGRGAADKEKSFLFSLTSTKLAKMISQFSKDNTILTDCTFKVVENLQMGVIGGYIKMDDVQYEFVPAIFFFTNRKDEAAYERAYKELSGSGVKTLKKMRNVVDMETAISNGGT